MVLLLIRHGRAYKFTSQTTVTARPVGTPAHTKASIVMTNLATTDYYTPPAPPSPPPKTVSRGPSNTNIDTTTAGTFQARKTFDALRHVPAWDDVDGRDDRRRSTHDLMAEAAVAERAVGGGEPSGPQLSTDLNSPLLTDDEEAIEVPF